MLQILWTVARINKAVQIVPEKEDSGVTLQIMNVMRLSVALMKPLKVGSGVKPFLFQVTPLKVKGSIFASIKSYCMIF